MDHLRVSRFRLVLAAACAILVGCGGSGTEPKSRFDHLEIRIGRARPFYPVADTARVSVVGVLADGSIAPVSGTVTWRSSDPSIISLPASGSMVVLRMVARGTARVTAEAEGLSAQLDIVVKGILHEESILLDESWRVADGPHVVRGLITVGGPYAPTLTIEPGSEVFFAPGSMLLFGYDAPGRMVIPADGPTVTMAGDSAGSGTWIGLAFFDSLRSELRNLSLRHCGGAPIGGTLHGCLMAGPTGAGFAPTLLVDGVTISGAHDVGMMLDHFVTFAPGSRNLSIVDGDGHIATIRASQAGTLPLGGRFEGSADNSIWIDGGLVTESATWRSLGTPWRIVSRIDLDEVRKPVVTIPAGSHVRADPSGGFLVVGTLVVGDPDGPPVVLESTGDRWSGIEIGDGGVGARLHHVSIRDCGASFGPTSACIRVFGGRGTGTSLLTDDVTIRDARGAGILFTVAAHFEAGSKDLIITGSAGAPIEIPPDGVWSIPTGNYDANASDVIRLRGNEVTTTASWRDPGVPILATTGLDIRNSTNDPVLTLGAGITLLMPRDTRVVVADFLPGALRVAGTAERPVVMAPETPADPGWWLGVELGRNADSRTRFEYLEIRGAGAGPPGWGGGVRMWVDPGGVLRNTTIRGSPTCGVVLFNGSTWAEDYTTPSFGNVFADVAGPLLCRPT